VVPGLDVSPFAIHFLVSNRRSHPQGPGTAAQFQFTGMVDPQIGDAVHANRDSVGIGAAGYGEDLFDIVVVGFQSDEHALVHLSKTNFLIGRYVPLPLLLIGAFVKVEASLGGF